MGHVRTLLDQANALETMFPGRHFTLDGHLVGSVGEVAAAFHYGIELFPPSTELHDGFADGRNVQIKITQAENVLIGEEPEYLVVLYLASTRRIYEVYNGPGDIPWKTTSKTDKRGYKHLRVNRLMNLDKEIKPKDRMPSLFAGKLHAVICRAWKSRVKGRDLYDYIFYLSRNVPVNLRHLNARLLDSGFEGAREDLSLDEIKGILRRRFDVIDFDQAREDVLPFIRNLSAVDVWSRDFFVAITENLKAQQVG